MVLVVFPQATNVQKMIIQVLTVKAEACREAELVFGAKGEDMDHQTLQ